MNPSSLRLNIIILYSITLVSVIISVTLYFSRTKVAYVNSGILLEKYVGMQEAHELTDQKIGVWQTQLDTLVFRFENNLTAYKNNYDKLSEKERKEQERILTEEEQQLNKFKQNVEQLIASEEEKNTSATLTKVNSFIGQYAKSKGYDVVLGITSAGNILYGDESVDITEEIIEGLNKEYKK